MYSKYNKYYWKEKKEREIEIPIPHVEIEMNEKEEDWQLAIIMKQKGQERKAIEPKKSKSREEQIRKKL